MQPDFFEQTLRGKIEYLERRMHQMHKEIRFLKEVMQMNRTGPTLLSSKKSGQQMEMFGT